MSQAEVRDSLIRAFDVWSRVTNIAFYEKTIGPADIMIRFTRLYHHDGYPFDGKGKNQIKPIIISTRGFNKN